MVINIFVMNAIAGYEYTIIANIEIDLNADTDYEVSY